MLDSTAELEADGLTLVVPATVFHPKFFGTSRILARYIASLKVSGKTVLDMGCGSGLIALSAARAGAAVMAADVNPEAVRATRENAQLNHLNIEVICSDLFAALGSRRFDFIVWNPPFFRGEARTMAQRAFFAGPDLETLRRFADALPLHLCEGGAAYLILSADSESDVIARMFLEKAMTFETVQRQRWLREWMIIVEIRTQKKAIP